MRNIENKKVADIIINHLKIKNLHKILDKPGKEKWIMKNNKENMDSLRLICSVIGIVASILLIIMAHNIRAIVFALVCICICSVNLIALFRQK